MLDAHCSSHPPGMKRVFIRLFNAAYGKSACLTNNRNDNEHIVHRTSMDLDLVNLFVSSIEIETNALDSPPSSATVPR